MSALTAAAALAVLTPAGAAAEHQREVLDSLLNRAPRTTTRPGQGLAAAPFAASRWLDP